MRGPEEPAHMQIESEGRRREGAWYTQVAEPTRYLSAALTGWPDRDAGHRPQGISPPAPLRLTGDEGRRTPASRQLEGVAKVTSAKCGAATCPCSGPGPWPERRRVPGTLVLRRLPRVG